MKKEYVIILIIFASIMSCKESKQLFRQKATISFSTIGNKKIIGDIVLSKIQLLSKNGETAVLSKKNQVINTILSQREFPLLISHSDINLEKYQSIRLDITLPKSSQFLALNGDAVHEIHLIDALNRTIDVENFTTSITIKLDNAQTQHIGIQLDVDKSFNYLFKNDHSIKTLFKPFFTLSYKRPKELISYYRLEKMVGNSLAIKNLLDDSIRNIVLQKGSNIRVNNVVMKQSQATKIIEQYPNGEFTLALMQNNGGRLAYNYADTIIKYGWVVKHNDYDTWIAGSFYSPEVRNYAFDIKSLPNTTLIQFVSQKLTIATGSLSDTLIGQALSGHIHAGTVHIMLQSGKMDAILKNTQPMILTPFSLNGFEITHEHDIQINTDKKVNLPTDTLISLEGVGVASAFTGLYYAPINTEKVHLNITLPATLSPSPLSTITTEGTWQLKPELNAFANIDLFVDNSMIRLNKNITEIDINNANFTVYNDRILDANRYKSVKNLQALYTELTFHIEKGYHINELHVSGTLNDEKIVANTVEVIMYGSSIYDLTKTSSALVESEGEQSSADIEEDSDQTDSTDTSVASTINKVPLPAIIGGTVGALVLAGALVFLKKTFFNSVSPSPKSSNKRGGSPFEGSNVTTGGSLLITPSVTDGDLTASYKITIDDGSDIKITEPGWGEEEKFVVLDIVGKTPAKISTDEAKTQDQNDTKDLFQTYDDINIDDQNTKQILALNETEILQTYDDININDNAINTEKERTFSKSTIIHADEEYVNVDIFEEDMQPNLIAPDKDDGFTLIAENDLTEIETKTDVTKPLDLMTVDEEKYIKIDLLNEQVQESIYDQNKATQPTQVILDENEEFTIIDAETQSDQTSINTKFDSTEQSEIITFDEKEYVQIESLNEDQKITDSTSHVITHNDDTYIKKDTLSKDTQTTVDDRIQNAPPSQPDETPSKKIPQVTLADKLITKTDSDWAIIEAPEKTPPVVQQEEGTSHLLTEYDVVDKVYLEEKQGIIPSADDIEPVTLKKPASAQEDTPAISDAQKTYAEDSLMIKLIEKLNKNKNSIKIFQLTQEHDDFEVITADEQQEAHNKDASQDDFKRKYNTINTTYDEAVITDQFNIFANAFNAQTKTSYALIPVYDGTDWSVLILSKLSENKIAAFHIDARFSKTTFEAQQKSFGIFTKKMDDRAHAKSFNIIGKMVNKKFNTIPIPLHPEIPIEQCNCGPTALLSGIDFIKKLNDNTKTMKSFNPESVLSDFKQTITSSKAQAKGISQQTLIDHVFGKNRSNPSTGTVDSNYRKKK